MVTHMKCLFGDNLVHYAKKMEGLLSPELDISDLLTLLKSELE